MHALLKRFNTVCTDLDIGREGLRCLIAKDPTFPRPIKCGDTKQSPIFFDASELAEWLESKKQARGGAI